MNEPTRPTDAPATDGEEPSNPNVALGIVFALLGLVLMVTVEDARIAGLPFLVLGITFYVMGVAPARRKGTEGGSPEQPGPASGAEPGSMPAPGSAPDA